MEDKSAYLVRRVSEHESIGRLVEFPRYFEVETVNACNAACPIMTP